MMHRYDAPKTSLLNPENLTAVPGFLTKSPENLTAVPDNLTFNCTNI